MKYILIAVLILSLCLGFCLYSMQQIRKTSTQTLHYLQQSQSHAERKNLPHTWALLNRAEASWNDHEAFFGIVLAHAETDDILQRFAALKKYIILRDYDDYISGCAELITIVRHIREMQSPIISNLL